MEQVDIKAPIVQTQAVLLTVYVRAMLLGTTYAGITLVPAYLGQLTSHVRAAVIEVLTIAVKSANGFFC